jgi:hypothetical protein
MEGQSGGAETKDEPLFAKNPEFSPNNIYIYKQISIHIHLQIICTKN